MFGRVFRESPVFRWMWGHTSRFDLALSMCGVRAGDRLLYLGGADMRLFAALGSHTGLSGSAYALAATDAAANAARAAAEQAGVFAEVSTAAGDGLLPFEASALDIVIVDANAPLPDPVAYAEVRRVLRPGGRVVALAGGVSGGWLQKSRTPPGLARRLVETMAGTFPAARVLAERDGWVFVEALKGKANDRGGPGAVSPRADANDAQG